MDIDVGQRTHRIEEERGRQGFTIQQLADMCRISKSTVSRTLSGETTPTEYTLHAMEDALGILDTDVRNILSERYADDPHVEQYIMTQEARIDRLRAYYNRELSEKEMWICRLFVLCLVLVALLVLSAYFVESPA